MIAIPRRLGIQTSPFVAGILHSDGLRPTPSDLLLDNAIVVAIADALYFLRKDFKILSHIAVRQGCTSCSPSGQMLPLQCLDDPQKHPASRLRMGCVYSRTRTNQKERNYTSCTDTFPSSAYEGSFNVLPSIHPQSQTSNFACRYKLFCHFQAIEILLSSKVIIWEDIYISRLHV